MHKIEHSFVCFSSPKKIRLGVWAGKMECSELTCSHKARLGNKTLGLVKICDQFESHILQHVQLYNLRKWGNILNEEHSFIYVKDFLQQCSFFCLFVLRMAGVSNMIQNNYFKCNCLSALQNDHLIGFHSMLRITENN